VLKLYRVSGHRPRPAGDSHSFHKTRSVSGTRARVVVGEAVVVIVAVEAVAVVVGEKHRKYAAVIDGVCF
jgi:hypothetical protein